MELILSREKIKEKIKNFNKSLDELRPNKIYIFIGLLEGTLPFCIDLLRYSSSVLSEMDYIFYEKNKFTKLKQSSLQNKNVVVLIDHLKNSKNKLILKLLKNINLYSPDTLSFLTILKDSNYKKPFDNDLDFILESDENINYCGYGLESNSANITDYLNLYKCDK